MVRQPKDTLNILAYHYTFLGKVASLFDGLWSMVCSLVDEMMLPETCLITDSFRSLTTLNETSVFKMFHLWF